MLAFAAEADSEADEIERHAKARALVLRAQAKLWRESANQGLTMNRQDSIVQGKVVANVAMQGRYVRQAASRTRSDSKAKKHLLEHGFTDSMIATALSKPKAKVGRSTVNAWMNGRNAIPDHHATTLQGPPYLCPRSYWSRIS